MMVFGTRRLSKLMLSFVLMVSILPLSSVQVFAVDAPSTVPYLQNGSFETGAGGLDNWTKGESRVNLGVTTLGGCLTVDMQDYTGIWTRNPIYGSVPTWSSSMGPKPINDNDTGSFSGFSVSTVTTIASGVVPTGSNAVKLTLASGSGTNGYHVVHGPSIVSDVFRR